MTKVKGLLVLVVLVGISLFMYHKNKKPKIDKSYQQELTMRINFALKQNRIKEAIDAIKEMQRLYSNHPEVQRFNYILAQLYLTRDEFDKAMQAMDAVMKQDERPEYLLLKGRIYQQQQQYQAALDVYEDLRNKGYIPGMLASADIYIAQYEIDKAQQVIEKIPEDKRGKYGDLVFMAGKIEMTKGNYAKAEELFHSFLVGRPYVIPAHILYIRVLSVQGKLNEARTFYARFTENAKKSDYSFYKSMSAMTVSPSSANEIYATLTNKSTLDLYHSLRNKFLLQQYTDVVEMGEKLLRRVHRGKIRTRIQSLVAKSYANNGEFDKANLAISEKAQVAVRVKMSLLRKDVTKAKNICRQVQAASKKQLFRLQIARNIVSRYEENNAEVVEKTTALEKDMLAGMSEYGLLLQDIAQAFLAEKKYAEAGEYFRKIYATNTSIPQLLLTSQLWHGVCEYLQGNKDNARVIWEKASQVPWQNYIVDERTVQLLDSILRGKPSNCEFDLQNDALFFRGIYYMDKEATQSQKFFQQAQEKSVAREFPYAIAKMLQE
ncbi:tetratricopeptide repeat protein [Candidatus Uabimicrobium amorphum]|uniref:Beta-barrel assembly-enhancing protease n=1 Tax=Uabimicrobium amorphum TaxID=2596890 RepID=A0A5S9ITC1_UABAM|nr:tetratricopeptide repeat protein [Candidatus Uabimicrobium amorphum]BBM87773.1 beta-barrel assembly-enhancing protease [Candidatus Uabimicrobium amorphum]